MTPFAEIGPVQDAIQKVKAGASAFTTNFFPAQRKLEDWIARGELCGELRDGAAFFFRRDRDFWHLHFAAADVESLRRQLKTLRELTREPMVTDLIGNDASLSALIEAFEEAGFRRYSRLQRMARPGQPQAPAPENGNASVDYAVRADAKAVAELIEACFDVHADQLPDAAEIAAVIENRQVLIARVAELPAALLYFETQGFTSAVRYWAVAEKFRSMKLGAALMRRYLEGQPGVRRFVLWVGSQNRNAIEKYEHYGYKADGLLDQILANPLIPG